MTVLNKKPEAANFGNQTKQRQHELTYRDDNILRLQCQEKKRHWLAGAFERNDKPQLIIRVTEIKKDSIIDTIIKARNLVRKYPELRWDVYVKPTNPDSISQMKPADASIDTYDKAVAYILAAELKGLL